VTKAEVTASPEKQGVYENEATKVQDLTKLLRPKEDYFYVASG
jgi:hypothetical protein